MGITEEILKRVHLAGPEEAAVRKHCGLPLSDRQQTIVNNLISFDLDWLLGRASQKLARVWLAPILKT